MVAMVCVCGGIKYERLHSTCEANIGPDVTMVCVCDCIKYQQLHYTCQFPWVPLAVFEVLLNIKNYTAIGLQLG